MTFSRLGRVVLPVLLAALGLVGCGGGGSSTPAPEASLPPQITWLRQAALPLASAEPESPEGDLAFLDRVLGGAPLIGLGEATHGSSEFQKLKHRLFRYLVLHQGVRLFALEAQMGACRAIDLYLLTGQGNPAEVLKGQGFWVWSTQEMLDQLAWMRTYNRDPAHVQKLRFFGFDMQDGGTEMGLLLDYLRPVDPQAVEALSAWFAPYRPFTWAGGAQSYPKAPASLRIQCHDNLQRIRQWMLDHQAAYVAATGEEAYAWALRMAEVLVQAEAMRAVEEDYKAMLNQRDRAMADNVEWLAQGPGAGQRMVLSAHNGHVNKQGDAADWTTMGAWLSQRQGARYFTLGFAFDHGGTTAYFDNLNGTFGPLAAYEVPPAPAGSYENTLVQAGLDLAFLDLRNLDPSQPGPAWFQQRHEAREVGSAWNPLPAYSLARTRLPARFDSLIFLKSVSATRLLP